jgi:hypothetical protein
MLALATSPPAVADEGAVEAVRAEEDEKEGTAAPVSTEGDRREDTE